MRETIDTTYADLRPTDLVIDKSGQAWPIADISVTGDTAAMVAVVDFWLCDPVTNIRMHAMSRDGDADVKVSRLPTQADEASKLEADFPGYGTGKVGDAPPYPKALDIDANYVDITEAVAAVEEIGGTVEAEVTAAEVDAAAAATDDAPVSLPPFADMTPLEQRSHLYLLHGLYGSDVTGKAELIAIHDQAHAQHDAGTLNSRHIPHVHEEA
jgi:hypothetical protein